MSNGFPNETFVDDYGDDDDDDGEPQAPAPTPSIVKVTTIYLVLTSCKPLTY